MTQSTFANNSNNNSPIALVIIEADWSKRTELCQFFEKDSYQVFSSVSPIAAETLLSQLTKLPDLILMNLLVEGTEEAGLHFCRQLKTNPTTKNIPLVVYTEQYKLDYMNHAYAAKADYYLDKNSESLAGIELKLRSILFRHRRLNKQINKL